MPANTKSREYLKYKFSDDELKELAQRIARGVQQKKSKEDEKKAVMAQFKSLIDSLAAEIGDDSQRLTNGYEMRNTECETAWHYPEEGRCTTFRCDTGEIVRQRKMNNEECQENLFGSNG